MGSSPQQENTNPASDAYNFLTPRSPLPRMPQMQSTPAQIAAGIYNGAILPTMDFMASPTGIATAGIPIVGGLPAKVMQTALTPVMAKNAYDTTKNAVKTIQNPNASTQDIATAGSGALLGMAGLGVGKGKSKEMSIDDAVSIINSNLGEDPKGFFSPHEVALKALKPVSPAIKKLLTSDEARENGGQDHNVYYDPETKTWLKMTVAGRYGSQSKDTPVDYLQNLKRLDNLNNDALGYKVVGTIKNESGLPPSIVTRVNHIAGEHPKDEAERDAFLTTHGFTPVGYNKFTIPDGRGIIEDAHTQNVKVVNHPEGGTFPMFIDGWVQPNE